MFRQAPVLKLQGLGVLALIRRWQSSAEMELITRSE